MSGVLEYTVHLVFRDNGLCPQQLAPGCHAPQNSGYFVLCLGGSNHNSSVGRTLGRLRFSDHAMSFLIAMFRRNAKAFVGEGVDA